LRPFHRLLPLFLLFTAPAATLASDLPSPDESGDERAEEAESEPARPWANGVSREDQKRALQAFRDGNQFFVERDFKKALSFYAVALSHWQHPAVHFNAAVCQVNLELPVEAYENLQSALSFGEAPLGADAFGQAKTYEKLLEVRIGRAQFSSGHVGIRVTLDGQVILSDAGETEVVLLAGEHQLVGEADGYLTLARTIQVVAGEIAEVELELSRPKKGDQYERYMGAWVPWTVASLGAAVLGAGVGMKAVSAQRYDQYGEDLKEQCPTGCATENFPDNLKRTRDSAAALDVSSLISLGVGAAALVTGASLIVYNQPRKVSSEEVEIPDTTSQLRPLVGIRRVGLSWEGSF